ncbi:hypothetical protein KSZ_39840 [Dictyobacter formicarum]|uniref:Uncharacterized protein n=1 Tax=Dictyobacter formicarum TaxID=2778368 RepID=A0ABQ3VJH7_9CHLR|nr:hypothetical protein KSZ_39840 [Dictyobacter formicarum]
MTEREYCTRLTKKEYSPAGRKVAPEGEAGHGPAGKKIASEYSSSVQIIKNTYLLFDIPVSLSAVKHIRIVLMAGKGRVKRM